MRIGVLTSSRADFGIYLPLLVSLEDDKRFDLEIIAFGMHLQASQGATINEIEKHGFEKVHKIGHMPESDEVYDIVVAYGQLVKDFALFWEGNNYDLVLCLGDRWEMSAAVQSTIPYEIRVAHIHGGETTLGAIDNIYRHQISLASMLHFTAAEEFSRRVQEVIGHKEGVHTVGSISLEGIENIPLPTWDSIRVHFCIPFDEFVLVTIHPESVGLNKNHELSEITFSALEELSQQMSILITQANSDALGSLYNSQFSKLEQLNPSRIKLVKSLGKLNYFKAIQQCSLMLGNTSSGIIESASFNKWVVNVGNRQKGRLRNANVIDVPFIKNKIIDAVRSLEGRGRYAGGNRYQKPKTVENIIKLIVEHA